jgi:zinc finger SWIM domain-containing protein 3
MGEGDAGSLLSYFQKQQVENPSLFYAIQLDVDDLITNVFWTDRCKNDNRLQSFWRCSFF